MLRYVHTFIRAHTWHCVYKLNIHTPHQTDEVPVEYAGQGGQNREREGQGRRRQVGQRNPRHGDEEGGDEDTRGDGDTEDVTTKDSS